MLDNAKEAREIITCGVMPGDIDSLDLAEAKGYLEALEGPEVKALVEALNELILRDGAEQMTKAFDALAQYRKVVKK